LKVREYCSFEKCFIHLFMKTIFFFFFFFFFLLRRCCPQVEEDHPRLTVCVKIVFLRAKEELCVEMLLLPLFCFVSPPSPNPKTKQNNEHPQ